MLAVKPPTPGLSTQLFAVYVTPHPVAANAGNPGITAAPATATAPTATAASLRRLKRLKLSLMPVYFLTYSRIAGAFAQAWHAALWDEMWAWHALCQVSRPGP